jgi:hypothetical protein
VDTWVWHKIGLELVEIDVQGTVETKGCGDGGDDWSMLVTSNGPLILLRCLLTLSNQSVQVLVVRTLNVQVATANIVDGLVVDHERAVRVLESGVGCQDGVVRLNDRCSDLRSWVNAEFKLALLAIVDGQALHEECTKSRTGTTTEGVEH